MLKNKKFSIGLLSLFFLCSIGTAYSVRVREQERREQERRAAEEQRRAAEERRAAEQRKRRKDPQQQRFNLLRKQFNEAETVEQIDAVVRGLSQLREAPGIEEKMRSMIDSMMQKMIAKKMSFVVQLGEPHLQLRQFNELNAGYINLPVRAYPTIVETSQKLQDLLNNIQDSLKKDIDNEALLDLQKKVEDLINKIKNHLTILTKLDKPRIGLGQQSRKPNLKTLQSLKTKFESIKEQVKKADLVDKVRVQLLNILDDHYLKMVESLEKKAKPFWQF